MKKINILLFSIFVWLSFMVCINAETISMRRISNENLNYRFDTIIGNVINENNINIVKGVIYYDSDLINNIELVQSSNWEVVYKLDNEKVYFVTYVIDDYAITGDSLFNINVTINENLEEEKIGLLINDLMTSNGDNIFNFNKMEYKFQNLNSLVMSEPEIIDKGTLEKWFENVLNNKSDEVISDTPLVDSNNVGNQIQMESDDEVKDSNDQESLLVPEDDKINMIESITKYSNSGLNIIVGLVILLFTILIVYIYVLYKKIEKKIDKALLKEYSIDNENIKSEVVKKKRRGRKKNTEKGEK